MNNSLPKSLSCRLGVNDLDIREDLEKHAKDKTERIKKIYRLGLQAESSPIEVKRFKMNIAKPSKTTSICLLRPADSGTVHFYESRIRKLEAQLESLRQHSHTCT